MGSKKKFRSQAEFCADHLMNCHKRKTEAACTNHQNTQEAELCYVTVTPYPGLIQNKACLKDEDTFLRQITCSLLIAYILEQAHLIVNPCIQKWLTASPGLAGVPLGPA